MAKAQVIEFTGDTKLDIDPDKVLEDAKGKLTVALVLGYAEDGSLWCGTSTGDLAVCNLLLDHTKLNLITNVAAMLSGEED